MEEYDAPTPPDDALIGGRYRKIRSIGRGGMGEVWLCRDETLGRDVAIKQAGGLPGEDDTGHSRARREARLAASLNHPNAVAIYDVVEDHGAPWLVMEYVDAINLSQLIRQRGTLRAEEIAPIAAQVAKALAAAHKRGIVHRDVKPSNILVDRFGIAKITDFGIAKANTDPQLTRTGMLAGTPAYFAPEVARGRTPAPPSDVWALGATIFHATEGAPPYGMEENTIALLYRIGIDEPAEAAHAGVLAPVLRHMLDTDVDARWTMAMAADKLAEVSTGGGAVSLSSATGPTGAPGAVASIGPAAGPPSHPGTAPTQAQHPQTFGPGPGGTAMAGAAVPGPRYPPTGAQYPSTGAPYPQTGGQYPQTGVQYPQTGHGPTYPPTGHPVSGPMTGQPIGYAPTEPRRKSRTPLIVALAAALAVAAAGLVIVLANRDSPDNAAAGDTTTATTTSAAVTTTPAATTTTPGTAFSEPPPATTVPTTTKPPPTTTPPPTTPNVAEIETQLLDIASSYYSLLPWDPETAWTYLGGTLAAKSYDSYLEFWNSVLALDFDLVDVDANALTVTIDLYYDLPDKQLGERTILTFEPDGGTYLIAAAKVAEKLYEQPK